MSDPSGGNQSFGTILKGMHVLGIRGTMGLSLFSDAAALVGRNPANLRLIAYRQIRIAAISSTKYDVEKAGVAVCGSSIIDG